MVGSTVDLTSLAFGAHLVAQGVTAEQVKKLAANPNVKNGDKNESVFDMTEEKSAVESGQILKAVVGQL